ncbi:MAG: hypothetical protein P8Y44_11035 [Acidobacteriota bacterium]
MKAKPCGANFEDSSWRYERNTSASACTSESKLKAKSTEASSTIGKVNDQSVAQGKQELGETTKARSDLQRRSSR